MNANAITIRLGSDHLDVDVLIESLKQVIAILEHVESNLARGEAIQWDVVSSKMASPLEITLEPRSNGRMAPRHGQQVVRACIRGIRSLSTQPSVPEGFDEKALNAARTLAQKSQKADTVVTVEAVDESPAEASPAIIQNVEFAVAKAKSLYEYGTVEGQLDTVTVRDGRKFVVFDPFAKIRVDCHLGLLDLNEAVSLLGRRVSVEGKIRTKFGDPVSIQADSIRRLRDRDELPALDDIPKLNITNGIPAEDFVRELRDE